MYTNTCTVLYYVSDLQIYLIYFCKKIKSNKKNKFFWKIICLFCANSIVSLQNISFPVIKDSISSEVKIWKSIDEYIAAETSKNFISNYRHKNLSNTFLCLCSVI